MALYGFIYIGHIIIYYTQSTLGPLFVLIYYYVSIILIFTFFYIIYSDADVCTLYLGETYIIF